MKKIIEKNKDLIINLMIVLIFGAIITISYSNSSTLNYDIIWLFHTSQKVTNGYTMYTEINTVLTPIFFWIGALFIKIFGNKLLSMYIFSGLVGGAIIATLYNIMKKNSRKNNNILFLICTIFALKFVYIFGLPNYNTLAIMWWLFAVFLELKNTEITDYKLKIKNNILIGVFAGLTIFTKQNIGIFALVSSITITIVKNFLDKNENFIKECLSKICGILIVVFGMLIYFIISGSFYSFIDYCVGGIFEFSEKNTYFKLPKKYVIVILFSLLGMVISSLRKNKKLSVLTITQICFMTLIYPVSNSYHVLLSMIPLLPLFASIIEYVTNNKNAQLCIIIFLLLVVFVPVNSTVREFSEFEKLFLGESLYGAELTVITMYMALVAYTILLIFEKESFIKYVSIVSISFLCISQIFVSSVLNNERRDLTDLNIYAEVLYREEVMNYIADVVKYIKHKENEGKRVLVVSADASYYNAPLEKNNYVFDFPLYGSLGFEGEEKLIDNLAIDENTIILKNKYMMYQESKILDLYIKENCQKVDEIRDLDVFEKIN